MKKRSFSQPTHLDDQRIFSSRNRPSRIYDTAREYSQRKNMLGAKSSRGAAGSAGWQTGEVRTLGQKGFTLLEVMVATMVTSLLMIMVVTFLINTVAQNIIDTARSDLLREAQLTLDNLGREIRLSANADEQNRWEDANAPAAPTDLYSWDSDADTLILATAAMDSNKNILFSDPLHYITSKNNNIYFVEGGTLYKRVLADTVTGNIAETTCPPSSTDTCPDDRELVHNVTGFSVKYFDNQGTEVPPSQARSVEVTLSMQQVKYGQTIASSYTTRTVFRNE